MGAFNRARSQEANPSADELFPADKKPSPFDNYRAVKWHLNDVHQIRLRLVWEGCLRDLRRGVRNTTINSITMPVWHFGSGTIEEFRREDVSKDQQDPDRWVPCDDPRETVPSGAVADSRPKILLVDTDKSSWMTYRNVFRSAASKTVMATTVREAQARAFNGTRFNAVIVKDVVADCSTEALIRYLRVNGWQGKIVALSDNTETRERLTRAGATAAFATEEMASFFHKLFSRLP